MVGDLPVIDLDYGAGNRIASLFLHLLRYSNKPLKSRKGAASSGCSRYFEVTTTLILAGSAG